MSEEQVERRLAAILAADVVGYSRLMEANEERGAPVLAFLGERERAKEWLARAMAIDPDDNVARYNAACTYSLLGEIDRSLDLLEICLQQFGSDMKLWIRNDSDLDPIRSHPRYRKLLEPAG